VLLRAASALLIGYLLGSVQVARVVARRHGVDLDRVGDRNPGYWNAKEQLGRSRALPVFVGDAAKGALAAAAGLALVTDEVWGIAYVAVAGAMLGHAWPVNAFWRGGRSVLTFVGGAVVLAPAAALVALVACVLVALVSRSFAWGARVGVFGFPLAQLLFDTPNRVAATGALMSIIGVRFTLAARSGRAARN
jgi:glycerol-3-phosphate acyltransferase PlsY